MKNAAGRIVYVGKAKHLRRRLASYFQPKHRLPPKVRIMMPRVEVHRLPVHGHGKGGLAA
jgi:excinuclease ABC subunit C